MLVHTDSSILFLIPFNANEECSSYLANVTESHRRWFRRCHASLSRSALSLNVTRYLFRFVNLSNDAAKVFLLTLASGIELLWDGWKASILLKISKQSVLPWKTKHRKHNPSIKVDLYTNYETCQNVTKLFFYSTEKWRKINIWK